MADHPAPSRDRVGLTALWFGLFAGPLAWTLQSLTNYSLAAHSCFPNIFPLSAPALGGLRGIAFGVSLAALALCIAGAAVAYRDWSRTRAEHHGASGKGADHSHGAGLLETGEGRTRFMAVAGIITSTTFLIVVVSNTIAIFVVTPCQGG